jgi:hypothetical protein
MVALLKQGLSPWFYQNKKDICLVVCPLFRNFAA